MIRVVEVMLGEEDIEAVGQVLTTGMLTQGATVERFEAKLAGIVGGRHVIAVSSGTAALHLTLLALGIGRGDEVLTSAFTFPATVNVIELVGARHVLVDIDLGTYTMDVTSLEAAITPRTRAIMPVHEFGLMADMARINAIASRAGLAVIEDAACALGASQRVGEQKVMAGTAGAVGCFSFHPRKVVTTAEGGCVVTDDDGLARRLRALRSHGLETTGETVDLRAPGLNYRLTELQAALGVVQVGRLDWALSRRRQLAAEYDERLMSLDGVARPHEPPGRFHTYQSYVVRLPAGRDREAVIAALREDGIQAVRGGYAVHRLHYYRERYGYHPRAFPVASDAHNSALALPLYPGMSQEAMDRVARGLIVAMGK